MFEKFPVRLPHPYIVIPPAYLVRKENTLFLYKAYTKLSTNDFNVLVKNVCKTIYIY
jgi:hypothetical protein